MTMKPILDGKKAVIIGGAGRIGSAVAAAFIENGATVLLVDQSEQNLLTVQTKVDPDHLGRCQILVQTLHTPKEAELLVARIKSILQRVDILVNCPGYIYRSSFLTHSLDELDELWRRNVKIVFLTCQAVGKFMTKQGFGKIINFASVGGVRPEREHSGYCAAKAAVIAFSRVVALELAQYRIQVNVIAPGPTETVPFTSPYYLDHPEVLHQIETATPVGRIGHPEDHTGVLTFLASDASNWVTGQVIMSDGGLSLS
jgi:NAD(P)-dependent dehydrogenase (short-subunit alcohol dehydrogenase family)